MSEVAERVKEIVAEQLGVDKEKIQTVGEAIAHIEKGRS